MISKLIKLLYKKYLYPELLKYVQSTDNEYDDVALAFVDDVIDLLLLKMDSSIQNLKNELTSENGASNRGSLT